jgi:hypothetical protein
VRDEVGEQIDGAVRHLLRQMESERFVPSNGDGGRQHPPELLELEPRLWLFQAPGIQRDPSEQIDAQGARSLHGFDDCAHEKD